MVNDEFRLRASDGSQPQSRMEMTDGERPAAVDDELRSTVRLHSVADGVQPAAMVTDGERPTVTDDVRRQTASDGSPTCLPTDELKRATGGGVLPETDNEHHLTMVLLVRRSTVPRRRNRRYPMSAQLLHLAADELTVTDDRVLPATDDVPRQRASDCSPICLPTGELVKETDGGMPAVTDDVRRRRASDGSPACLSCGQLELLLKV